MEEVRGASKGIGTAQSVAITSLHATRRAVSAARPALPVRALVATQPRARRRPQEMAAQLGVRPWAWRPQVMGRVLGLRGTRRHPVQRSRSRAVDGPAVAVRAEASEAATPLELSFLAIGGALAVATISSPATRSAVCAALPARQRVNERGVSERAPFAVQRESPWSVTAAGAAVAGVQVRKAQKNLRGRRMVASLLPTRSLAPCWKETGAARSAAITSSRATRAAACATPPSLLLQERRAMLSREDVLVGLVRSAVAVPLRRRAGLRRPRPGPQRRRLRLAWHRRQLVVRGRRLEAAVVSLWQSA